MSGNKCFFFPQELSLYSSIGDFFMIWRLIKDFKSNIVFSVGFDYDIGTYYV